jgi:dihydroxyacetone kinase-like protein
MTVTLTRQLIEAVATSVIAAAEELTALDRETGDGDHGVNMKRGCEAVLAQLDQLCVRPLPEALKGIGNILQMKVGGASGPLYGTLFVSLGRALAHDPHDLAAALEGAVVAIERMGKSQPGCKTMLDVLVPVQQQLRERSPDLLARLEASAAEGAKATIAMKALRGRAAFMGERSIGHMDPGARSAHIMVSALCEALA